MLNHVLISKRSIACAALPPVILSLAYFGIDATNVFPGSINSPGHSYLAYNALKLLIIPIVLLLLHNIGYAILLPFESMSSNYSFEDATINTGVGLAMLNVIVFVSGYFGWLSEASYFVISLGILLLTWRATEKLAMLLSPVDFVARQSTTLLSIVLWLFVFIVLAIVIAFKSIVPDVADNDILGGYVPYFATAKEYEKSLWDTWFFIHFFIGKGGGLQALITQLVDAHSINLAGGCALILCLAVFISGGIKLTGSGSLLAVGTAAVLLMLSNSVALAKPHLVLTSIMGCLLLVFLRSTAQDSLGQVNKCSSIILLLGAVTYTTVTAGLIGPFVFLLAALALISKRMDLAGWFIRYAFILILSLLCVFALNVLTVGLPEYAISFLDVFGDMSVMSKSWSPVGIFLQREFNSSDHTVIISRFEVIFTYLSSVFLETMPQISGVLAGLCIFIFFSCRFCCA